MFPLGKELAENGKMEKLGMQESAGGAGWVFYMGVTFGLIVIISCSGCILALFCVAKRG